MLYIIPIWIGLLGIRDALRWTADECHAEGFVSGLSRLLCGSSLLFLLVATALEIWGNLPRDSSIPEVLAYFYLLVLMVRFSGAGLANLVISVPCLIFGRGLDRLCAFSALLCSGAGLHIVLSRIQAHDGEQYQAIALFCALNFCYGLVYGGGLQWLVRELARPDETLS